MTTQDTELIRTITEAVQANRDAKTEILEERLAQMDAQLHAIKMEDEGWLSIFGANPDDNQGFNLESLKEWSTKLRESVAGSPLPKQANVLRHSYTFSQPFIIPELPEKPERKPGARPKTPTLSDFYYLPLNQRYVFGKEAQELISTACSTDGVYIALGNDEDKTVRSIPLSSIDAVYVNPEFPDEIWAYLRSWSVYDRKGAERTEQRWYYTDRYTGERQNTLPNFGPGTDNTEIKVDRDKTILDFMVNQQSGWTFGVPDLQPGFVWNRKYVTMMNHGEEVSAALAHFAMIVRTKTQKGADKIGVKMAGTGGKAGNTAVLGEGNEMGALTSARSAYDFEGLRPVASMAASAWGVSVVDLLASPSAAGSSYGSASALMPGQRRAIETRRLQWAAFLERVIQWGTGKPVQVTPASIEEVEPYRRGQIVAMMWNTGLIHEDEARPEMMRIAGLTPNEDKAPDGVLLPNNEFSLARKDIDADGQAGSSTTVAAPDQGMSNGSGGQGSAASKDISGDNLSD